MEGADFLLLVYLYVLL